MWNSKQTFCSLPSPIPFGGGGWGDREGASSPVEKGGGEEAIFFLNPADWKPWGTFCWDLSLSSIPAPSSCFVKLRIIFLTTCASLIPLGQCWPQGSVFILSFFFFPWSPSFLPSPSLPNPAASGHICLVFYNMAPFTPFPCISLSFSLNPVWLSSFFTWVPFLPDSPLLQPPSAQHQ